MSVIGGDLAKLQRLELEKTQWNGLGLTRYKLERGDKEYNSSYAITISMDGINGSSPATTTERTAGLIDFDSSGFNRITFITPDGVGKTLYVASTSSSDNVNGTGARKVMLEGLNASWDLQTEEVSLNGFIAASTSNSNWLRINKVYVSDIGSNGSNIGDIYVSSVNSFATGVPNTNIINCIKAGFSHSVLGIYSIPRFHKLFFTQLNFFNDSYYGRPLKNPLYSTSPVDVATPNEKRIEFIKGNYYTQSSMSMDFSATTGFVACSDLEYTIQAVNAEYHDGDRLNPEDYSVSKFGRNKAADNADYEDVCITGGNINFLTSAATLEAVSASAEDDVLGDGARTVIIEGLDANGDVITEELDLIGNGASLATTNSFIRAYRAYVGEVGTYGATNYDNIIIRVSGGGATLLTISGQETTETATYGAGQTQTSLFCVPKGYTAYIKNINGSVDTGRSSSIVLFQRQGILDTATGLKPRRMLWEGVITQNVFSIKFDSLIKVPELSDIWVRAVASGGLGTSTIGVNYDLVLIKDLSIDYSIEVSAVVVKDPSLFN